MNRDAFIPHPKRFEPHLILFILCFVLERVGLAVHPIDSSVPLVWPGTALALAVIILFGYRFWWPVLLASILAYATAGTAFGPAVFIGVGNTLEVLAGAYVLRHVIGFDSTLVRLRDNVGLIVVAVLSPTIAATVGVASFWIFGGALPANAFPLWASWWSGDALAILAISPLLLKWLPRPMFRRTGIQYGELFLAVGAVLAMSLFIFWTPDNQFAYYIFIPLTWVALRTGPRGISLAIFAASVAAISGTLAGFGPYAGSTLFQLEVFLGTLATLFLIFTSVVEERKNAQNELGHHVEELEQALSKISSEDEAKKNFLAILAHELRNPLAAILSSIELLRLKNTEGAESSGLVRTIGEHVHAMRSMLDDVLDISRISRNKLALRKEVVSLNSIIDHSVESAGTLVHNRHHSLSVIKPSSPIFVDADPIRVEQILVNLLNNAAKYTNPGGTIEVRAHATPAAAVITLKDNGVGISKSMLKRIFEPFFQVKRGTLATEGLGVGLPLTRQLVEMHGGTIDVKSEGEGKGSEFTVTLPRARAGQTQTIKTGESKIKKLRFVKHTRSILVVDDNEAAANALSRLLQLRGHEVSVAYTGLSGVEIARKHHHDLLILDIGLPDIDGYEVVRRLQDGGGMRSAVIALTGYGQAEDKEKAMQAGFHYHLTKPVGLKELEKAFKKVEHVYENV